MHFYKKTVKDLKHKDPNKWYSTVKRLASYENKSDILVVDQINHLTDQEKCDLIAYEFTKIPNQYTPLHREDIVVPPFQSSEVPQFKPSQIWKKLASMKPNKSSQEGDVPAKVVRYFAAYLSDPLTSIINCAIRTGEYPSIWKEEIATPIPKQHPTLKP